MALTEADLSRLEKMLGADKADGKSLSSFRRNFPGLSLTRCDTLDMSGETPFRAYPGFDLYLVDGSNHCWRITDKPDEATGIVVAERH